MALIERLCVLTVVAFNTACGSSSVTTPSPPQLETLGATYRVPRSGGSIHAATFPPVYFQPAVAIGGDGRVVAAWSTGYEVWVNQLDPTTMRWGEPHRLHAADAVPAADGCFPFPCPLPGPPIGPVQLRSTPEGALAVWDVLRQGSFAADWTDGQWTVRAAIPDVVTVGAVAVGHDGRVTILSQDFRNGAVFLAERHPSLGWGAREVVDPDPGGRVSMDIALERDGSVVAAWASTAGVAARRRDAVTRTWSARTALDERTPGYVRLGAHSSTGAVAVWLGGQPGSVSDGVLTRRALPGEAWSARQRLGSGLAYGVEVRAGVNGAFVIWYQLVPAFGAPPSSSDIWMVRMTPDGRWGPSSRLDLSGHAPYAFRPHLALTAGGAPLTTIILSVDNLASITNVRPGATAMLWLVTPVDSRAIRAARGVAVAESDLVIDGAGMVHAVWLESSDGFETLTPVAARLRP